MASNQAPSLFGVNTPIRLTLNADGVSYSLTVATTTTTSDQMPSILGTNLPIRLISNGDGTFALAISAQ